MKSVQILTGKGIPLRRSDVDTDQIIPADWLKRVERTGFEAGLFSTWRDDRSFVLNDERYAGASILVAGPSFGVGSSREHAVWAIQQYGFDAVIAPSFSDIFRNNCTKNGLAPVALPIEAVEKIWAAIEADPAMAITVDLDSKSVAYKNERISFDLDDYTRWRLMEGLDDIGLTMRNLGDVEKFEEKRANFKPKTLPVLS